MPRTSEHKEKAVALYASGLSSYQVSEQLGIDPSLIWRWAKAAGINRGKFGNCRPRRLPPAKVLNEALHEMAQLIGCKRCPLTQDCGYIFEGSKECQKMLVKYCVDRAKEK